MPASPGTVFVVPTLYLQLAFVLCVITAAACGRMAERHRSPWPGIVAVLAVMVGCLLFALIAYRGAR